MDKKFDTENHILTLRLAHLIELERKFMLFALAIIALSKVNYKKIIQKGIERAESLKKKATNSNAI